MTSYYIDKLTSLCMHRTASHASPCLTNAFADSAIASVGMSFDSPQIQRDL
ncbi:hypothetical protein SERLA73DRAFT_140015, partial [Serpula lacrymans var. lacrymans S7.3]